eukprot:Protomagalhaensia_wolfi_Nauph_80__4936@NODE_519_length_2389_cov_10_600000_g387_i0_p1_GENE_NODE_519_length_2389_cov_10_600000_g387_i0NODE_519_length_2389_cov_10_600000_g387_i0_p1_ORF_typecomplete_len490_score112_96Hexokinase_2/PF03727_16/9e42Hexokinase_1/PF00349_21/2e39_NODE_519_length_2389_cov_10_600000_g387_i08172286
MTTLIDRRREPPRVNRARTWSETVQKNWTLQVPLMETFEQRAARYSEYLTLPSDHVVTIYENVLAEISQGLVNHSAPSTDTPSSLKMLDTCVSEFPDGSQKGTSYALDFGGTMVRALRVRLEGAGRISTIEHRTDLREVATGCPKGLQDRNCGAMALFNVLGNTVGELLQKSGAPKQEAPLGVAISFPCQVRTLTNACLIEWTKGFETGRATNDPVEGLNVATLLDMAFWRSQTQAKTRAVVDDATGTLLACCYERPDRLPPCTVSFLVGGGVNAAYVEPAALSFGYKGSVINTGLGGFDRHLPLTDVDLEVDYADEGGRGRQLFEKMVGGHYLGEVCRRLVLKVWQAQAPSLVWARHSMPTAAAALCVSDSSEDLEVVNKLLTGLWNFELDTAGRRILQKLFTLVFERSAALSAAAIAAFAKQSGRLQPAMGGVTVAIDGALHTSHPWYSENVTAHLKRILGEETAQYIHLFVSLDGAAKGAAILAAS